MYIGITENRMKHIVAVAEKCYALAKRESLSELDCRKAYMYGYLHDVGYAFSEKSTEHPSVGFELLEGIFNCQAEPIKEHGNPNVTQSTFLAILNEADLTVDSKGNNVTVEDRLLGISKTYGIYSTEYINAKELACLLNLMKR